MKDNDSCEMGNKQDEPYNCDNLLYSENFQAIIQGET